MKLHLFFAVPAVLLIFGGGAAKAGQANIRDVRPLLESGRAQCQQSMSQSAKCRLRAQLRITRYDRVSRSTDELD